MSNNNTQVETPSEYVQQAIRTDLEVDNLQADKDLLYFTINTILNAGEVLDQIKKNTFYGKPVDADKINECTNGALANAKQMQALFELSNSSQLKKVDYNTIDPKVFHSIVGVATEAVELLEPLLENISNGTPVDTINLLEEYGDINWYEALGINAVGGKMESVLETNIDKLKARFPDKFSADDAINRDTNSERDILEDGFKDQS